MTYFTDHLAFYFLGSQSSLLYYLFSCFENFVVVVSLPVWTFAFVKACLSKSAGI